MNSISSNYKLPQNQHSQALPYIGWERGQRIGLMRKFTLFLIILLLVTVGGGLAFLATWDIPAPSQKVEKVLDNDRFAR
ncbi:MAG: hypothetical protein GKS00_06965 [Alphaproteobacteria bacterium]|nr:hypothetical protein [Alphaproteobacteria bacterium]